MSPVAIPIPPDGGLSAARAGVWRSGRGPSLVLVHGIGLDHSVWAEQVAGLESVFTVVTYDLPGHGKAEAAPEAADLDSYADDLGRVMTQAGLDHAILVGAAFGSFIVRRFAQRHPERVDGLCLVSPLFRRTESQRRAVLDRVAETDRNGIGATLDASLERWLSPAYRGREPRSVEALRSLIRRTSHHGFMSAYRVFASCDGALADQSRALACPVRIITGGDDGNATPDVARALAAALGQDDVIVLTGMRHLVSIEAGSAMTEHLRAFGARCAAADSTVARHMQ